jgi:outer membrane biosynthesis protein TonB
MSPKTARPDKSESKPEKSEKKAPAKADKKAAKAAPVTEELEGGPVISTDEAEELEEAAEEAAASGSNSNAAALAAASGSTDMSASFKNFRHHPDMENFYRFIYENDLRHEALAIIDTIMVEKQARKAAKGVGKH